MSAVTWSRLCSHSHLFFELAARQQMQSRSCAALWTPPRSINASLVFARQLNRTRDEPGVSRKVWSAIVFGFELEMLRPPPLIERPGEFPASWFGHLHTCAAGTPRPNCTREARTRWARTVPGLRPRRRGKNVGK